MNVTLLAGLGMTLALFIALSSLMARYTGWVEVAKAWVAVVALTIFIGVAATLIVTGLEGA